MPFSANCPSCGAPVVFKSSVSFHGVCEFCRSTLVRHGEGLENLGKMADLLEDASPIQLGTEGRYKGVHFAVIGRIQLRYPFGIWNEWYLLFDDQRGGWLSDANGEYIISFLKPPGATLPPFDSLKPDQTLTLAKREFVVTNLEEAMCVAGEGELPFAFGAGYPAQLADLRAPDDTLALGTAFATIDYSESPPLCFIGESLPFAGLRLTNLRTEKSVKALASGEVQALQCPACGGAITLHAPSIVSIACPSCLSVLDAADPNLAVLQKASRRLTVEPLIPLGATAKFEDKDWTLIGFQRRAVESEGSEYPWDEYLLHNPKEGLRWLTEANGHWSLLTVLSSPPRYKEDAPKVKHRGVEHVRFSTGKAVTQYVIGEFNWSVRVGETWQATDFIAPPSVLSRETRDNETTWTLGRYLTTAEIEQAFSLKTSLPEARQIAPNQPNPHREAHRSICNNFWKFFLLATVAQIAWIFMLGGKTLLEQQLSYQPNQPEPTLTKEFKLDSPARNVVVQHRTNLDNNWLGLNVTLIDKTTGLSWQTESEIAYWQGEDDGESWSEGDREREITFRDVPPGTYYLAIDPEVSNENPVVVFDKLHVVRDQAAWSSYFLLLVFLMVFPLISRYRFTAFESERWNEADFLPSGKEHSSSSDSRTGSSVSDGDSGGDGGGDSGGSD